MRTARLSGLCLLAIVPLVLAAGGPDKTLPQNPRSTSQIQVQSVAPQTISLTAGGPAMTVTMTGTGLGNILDVQVIQQSKMVEGFVVTLAPTSGATRAFDIKAAGAVSPGDYQLRLILKAQKRDLPWSLAKIIVGAIETRKKTAQRATAAAPPATAQTTAYPPPAAAAALRSKDSRIIRSSAFNSIAMNVFQGAYFDAMSCGGRDSERRTTVNVPNAYFKQEPLDRMEYQFTDGEKDRTSGSRGNYHVRRVEIRACVDAWRLGLDTASIENGKFKVAFMFGKIQVIITRAMYERTTFGIYAGDMTWDWLDQDADNAIRNFRFSGGLNIYLTPVIENGGLSYRLDDARWEFYGPLTGWIGPGYFRLPEVEEPKIVHYKDRMLETIRQRIMAVFNDAAVRAKLASALTQNVKTGDFAGRTIASVLGKGDVVEVTFQK
jgi:hypothetical protein